MPSRNLQRVATLAYDGLGTFEFGIVVEVFGLRRTGLGVPRYDFEVCSLERTPIRARRSCAPGVHLLRCILLAETGLLNGKRVTAHWRHVDRFAARFPNVRLDPGEARPAASLPCSNGRNRIFVARCTSRTWPAERKCPSETSHANSVNRQQRRRISG